MRNCDSRVFSRGSWFVVTSEVQRWSWSAAATFQPASPVHAGICVLTHKRVVGMSVCVVGGRIDTCRVGKSVLWGVFVSGLYRLLWYCWERDAAQTGIVFEETWQLKGFEGNSYPVHTLKNWMSETAAQVSE